MPRCGPSWPGGRGRNSALDLLPDLDIEGPEWFRAALAREPERAFVASNGVEIETLAWGPGGAPGILLLHGFRAHADWWDHIAPYLAEGRRVVAMSWAGMGRSGWRDGYSIAGHAADATAVLEASGLFASSRPPIVIAHSFGGFVATRLSADLGRRLGGTVLVDVLVSPQPPSPPPDAHPRRWPTRAEAEARLRLQPNQESLAYVMANFARHGVTEHADDRGEGWGWRFDPKLSATTLRDRGWTSLPKITGPLAFVRGEHSVLVTPELEAQQRAQAPQGTIFVTIPDAAHHILADRPLALTSVLRTLVSVWEAAASKGS